MVPWDRMRPHHEGSLLSIDPSHQVRCINGESASEWAALIKKWKKEPQAAREASFAKKADAMLDTQSLKAHVETLFDATKSLRWYGAMIAICLFILLPFVYWLRGDTLPSYLVLGLLLLMMFVQSIVLWRLSGRNPSLRKERVQHVLACTIFPPSSMRAADWVCATLAGEYHPLAAHQAWNSVDQFQRQARVAYREALWPRRSEGDSTGEPCNGPHVQALKRFLAQHQMDLETLEQQPEAQQGCTQYCPRCLTQFMPAASRCADCSNLPLQPLV